ncbi:MAG: hypothetical protein WA477_12185 [Candidatus Sulfotelmatobacter sp.]
MLSQLLLFVIAVLLLSIFWVLSKINSLLKKTLLPQKAHDRELATKDRAVIENRSQVGV